MNTPKNLCLLPVDWSAEPSLDCAFSTYVHTGATGRSQRHGLRSKPGLVVDYVTSAPAGEASRFITLFAGGLVIVPIWWMDYAATVDPLDAQAFRVPQTDLFREDGYCWHKEEAKLYTIETARQSVYPAPSGRVRCTEAVTAGTIYPCIIGGLVDWNLMGENRSLNNWAARITVEEV